jgi:PAS domain S-box-containing protein
MCRMTGYDRNELVGSIFKQYFTEPERADLGVKRTFAENIVRNYELVLRAKSGRKATVSFNASIFRGADSGIEGIFASARDISEQARLQTQLAEQQAYNRSLIEASADALFAIAPDGLITDVNEEATRLTGHSRKHLVNSRFSEYFTDPGRAREGVLKTLAEGRVIGYELILITRYGRKIAVGFNAGVFTDAAGKPLGILAGARDITAQKALEQELRNQQFYTRSLIESNIDALMTTDPVGIISDINQQMEALTGSTRDELIGTPVKNYFTDPLAAEEGIRLVLREGKVTNYELTARAKNGNETVVSYNAATFNDRDGKLQGVFAAARDVTERKRFEQTLQEKNVEMEKANLAKDRFLASMSHELRTPLNAIIGFTGTLLMKIAGPLTEEQERQLKTVQSGGKHLLSLINDLLDLAKIESGKVDVTFEKLSGSRLIREVEESLGQQARTKGLEFVTIVPDQDVIVLADARTLRQILLNLVNNAIKFTEKGRVRLALMSKESNGGRSTVFEVEDTGIGIRPEDQSQLFRAFAQVDAKARGRGHEGTGLGLHVSQKLAELLSGQIECESQYGKGSKFSLVLGRSARKPDARAHSGD